MKDLKNNSIHISNGIVIACWPQNDNKEGTVDMTDIRSKFNGCYATNNSTICYVHENEVFVTPYTRTAIATLRKAGLTHENFYVPFSNWDYPKYDKAKWSSLLKKAAEQYDRDYENDCATWCDEHKIGQLSEEIMKRCFRIPRTGVPVKHPYFEDTVYPACNENMMDCTVINKLGHYCKNNGKVVFVYRDGHTYVTKGYKITGALQRAGYSESGLFVPFSNGERITDSYLADQWNQISNK